LTSDRVRALIARCVAGEGQARAEFCAEYHDLVLRAAARKLAALTSCPAVRSEAEDVCNEVFVRLLSDDCQALRRLRNPHSINAWIVTIARNHAIDHIRKEQSRAKLREAIALERSSIPRGIPDDAIAEERRAHLNGILRTLPAIDQLVLELYFMHGLKYAEIAEVLDLNINTVSSRLRRAKHKLRTLLQESRDGYPAK